MSIKQHLKNDAAKVLTCEPDFVFSFCEEKIPQAGEDGFYFGVGKDATCVSVFDGCGGSGARIYEQCQGATGAYLASRIASGALRDWYLREDVGASGESVAQDIQRRMTRYLSICQKACGQVSRIRGSMAKELPTTCSIVILRNSGGRKEALSIWAGDSRCYMLDGSGLHQLSSDDLATTDALKNISDDAAITNVVNITVPFELHSKTISIDGPCLLFAATDGCFGYLQSPMDFECILLDTLCTSSSPAEWEELLKIETRKVSGDDSTICGMSFGYQTFSDLVKSLQRRRNQLYEKYVTGRTQAPGHSVYDAWTEYRLGYEAYL